MGGKSVVACSILIVVLMSATAFFMLSAVPDSNNSQSQKVKISSYTVHAPIYINGNAQFTTPNGVTGGTGTASTPYIISGWEIDATTDNGIKIQGTTSYFIIRNCYIHGGGTNFEGILLAYCSHGTVINNICSDNYDSIYLYSSSDNVVSDNNCSSHNQADMFGIVLDSSNSNIIRGNNCSNNDLGIYLYASSSNAISNNTCNWNLNWDGIDLDSSSSNIVSNNNCSNNGNEGIYLVSSSSNTVSDNICRSNIHDGIGIELSINNIVRNNTCKSNTEDGIWLNASSNNTISRNQVRNNTLLGIEIWSGSGLNRIWNNILIGNNGSGGNYDQSHNQGSDNGTNNWWNSTDRGNYWFDWKTPDNLPPWRIVDNPYNLSGSAATKDYYPLSSAPEDSIPITTATASGTTGKNGWYVSNVSISLSATDSESGVNGTYYRNGTSGNWMGYSSSLVLSSDGNYTTQYYSMDNAANNEALKTLLVKIDKTSPESSATVTNSTVVIKATDATSGVNLTKYRIDSGAWLTYNGSFAVTASGNHTIEFHSIDKAGNNESIKTAYVNNGMDSGTMLLIALFTVITVIVLISVLYMIRKKNRMKNSPQVPPMQSVPMETGPPQDMQQSPMGQPPMQSYQPPQNPPMQQYPPQNP